MKRKKILKRGDDMIVHHGTTLVIPEPKIIIGNQQKDFGNGFYCTIMQNQARKWARKKSLLQSKKENTDVPAVVNSYQWLKNVDLKILEFQNMSEEWLDFIVKCRTATGQKENLHDYDLVIGPMADDKIFAAIQQYLEGEISRELFWGLVKFSYPTSQSCFCTEKSLTALKFVRAWERGQDGVWR